MLLSYEPLLNRQRAITGTRLFAHRQASGPTIGAALNELEEVWPGQRTVLLALRGALDSADLHAWQAPANALVELSLADYEAHGALVTDLRAREVSLCLSGVTAGAAVPDGDFRFLLAAPNLKPGAGLPGILIAEGPANVAAFEDCLARGFAGASGWFFLESQPQLPGKVKKLSPGHAHIVRLLNLVRNGAEVRDIEAALKQDVALSFKLLRYINSAGFGLQCEIQSFRHAVTILGYQKLNKWLSMLLVTASKDPAAPALMQAAVVRGRLMELLGADFFGKSELDNLFITGAFSLLDVLLGAPLTEILELMRLPEAIDDALLRGEGIYAPFLALARAVEGGDGPALARQVEDLGLQAEACNRAVLSALSFADSLLAG